MSGKSRGTPVTGGVEASMEKSQEANQSMTTGEQSRPRPSRQYRPNSDPSLYLYGNHPSTLEPYVSSIGDWNNPHDTQQQFQYGNPESLASNNVPNLGPYYLLHSSPYASANTHPSRVTSGTRSHAAQPEVNPYQGYGVSDPLNITNNPSSNNLGNRTGGGSAARSRYASRSGYGAYDEYDSSKTPNSTETLNDNGEDDEDEEEAIARVAKTAGRSVTQSTAQVAPRTASTTFLEQGVFGEAQHKPIEHSSDDEAIRHGQGRGKVQWENETMVWRELQFDGTEEPWQLAVYHYQIRHELITAANLQGNYDFPRDEGLAENDVTCFLSAQKTWNVSDRAYRPDILFQWKKAGHRNPTYVVPDWYHDGRIVLDPDNHPVRKFRNIPDACSSMLEGGIMEAIKREDSRITHQDFVARMLPEIEVETSKGRKSQPLYGKNAMAARMRRFREKTCCIVWGVRAGSDKICEYLETKLPAQCIADNSTRNFRDLYEHEILEIRKLNAGKFAERAGDRAIEESERKARARKQDARIKRQKEQFEKGQQSNGKAVARKRKRAATKDTVTEEDDAEVSDFAAGRRATAPRRKQRKANLPATIGVSRNGKSSEADWEDDSFELGEDGDDEGRHFYDEGCANPNADRQGREAKRPKLTDNARPAFGRTPRFWTSATPVADGAMANSAGVQNNNGQGFCDAGTTRIGSFGAVEAANIGGSAVNTVSEARVDDSNGVTFNEEMFNFYSSLSDDPNAAPVNYTSNDDVSNAALVNDGFFDLEMETLTAETTQYNGNLPNIQWDGLDALLGPFTEPNAEPNVEPNVEGTDLLGAKESYFEEFMLPFESEGNTPS